MASDSALLMQKLEGILLVIWLFSNVSAIPIPTPSSDFEASVRLYDILNI